MSPLFHNDCMRGPSKQFNYRTSQRVAFPLKIFLLLGKKTSRMKQEIVHKEGSTEKKFMNKYVPQDSFQRVQNLQQKLLGLFSYHGKFYCITNIGNEEPSKDN